MEEQLSHAVKDILIKDLPGVLALMEDIHPRMSLTAPAKVVCAESYPIDRASLPLVQIFMPSENEYGYSLVWPKESECNEHIYRFTIDIWIKGSNPEELYFKLMRYKSAIRITLRNNINLDGLAYGSIVRSSSNSNLMGSGDNLVLAGRLNYEVLAPAFFEYPKVGSYIYSEQEV
jgi:hypothetical protein